ncbi:MAG: hypothetical protein MRERC_2c099 [Mycoplasmataceae bacterium RC_NB112A]|nr:MAG: hypothetical protein MRERC_2c099 [Mycoplasmataceae bacterium RC_NB112A]
MSIFEQRIKNGIELYEIALWVNEYVNSVAILKLKIVLKLPNLNYQEWEETYSEKIIQVLQEIWETGEMKNSQELDLNWPVASKEENNPTQKPTNKESKTPWIIIGTISFAIVSLFFVIYLFRKRKKVKK